MITISLPGRARAWLGPMAALLIALCAAPARAVVLVEEAADDGTGAAVASGRWAARGVSSGRSHIGQDAGALTVDLAAGDHAAFSRTAAFSPAPTSVLCTFNVAFSGLGKERPVEQVFRIGWEFGSANA